jgi:hypothetical protein
VELKDTTPAKEGEQILAQVKGRDRLIALSEEGPCYGSVQFAEMIRPSGVGQPDIRDRQRHRFECFRKALCQATPKSVTDDLSPRAGSIAAVGAAVSGEVDLAGQSLSQMICA